MSCSGFTYEGPEEGRPNFTFDRSKTLKNAINSLQKNGGLFWDRLKEPSAWKKYLPLLFQMHINRWYGTPTPSKFLQEKHRRFYYELLNALGEEGVCIFRVRNRNIPIAISFNFDYNCNLTYFTLGINGYYAKRSPGQILMTLQGETFIKQGYTLDYSRGAHEYKNAFASRTTKNYEVTFYSGRSSYFKARAIERIKANRQVAALLESKKIKTLKLTISEPYKYHGFAGLVSLAKATAAKIRTYIFDFKQYLIYRFDTMPDPPIKPTGLSVRVKKLAAADIEQIATFYNAPEDSLLYKTTLGRFDKNADCFAVIVEGNIIALSWGLRHQEPDDKSSPALEPARDEALLCDQKIYEEYRDQNIDPYLLSFQINDYHKRGLKVFTVINKSDKPRQRILEDLGFRCQRVVRRLEMFGRRMI